MFDEIHRHLGQGAFALLLVVAIVGLIFGMRQRSVPRVLPALVHLLIGAQVIFGVFMLITGGLRGVSWVHPVIGVLTVATLDIGNRLRLPLRPGFQTALVYGLAAVLAIVARAIALGSRG